MKSPKWSDTKSSLQIGNIVYFRKVENELSSDWSLGKVVGVTFSRDGALLSTKMQMSQSKGRQIEQLVH